MEHPIKFMFNQLLFNFLTFIHFPRSFSQESCLLSGLRSSAYIAKPEPKGHNYVNEKRFDQDDKTQRKKENPITLHSSTA